MSGSWLLRRDQALIAFGRVKNPIVTLLCQCKIMAWQYISPEAPVKGLKSAIYPVHWMDLICCEMTVMRMGMVAVSVRKMKAPTVEMGE
jgi:hypothetical protein